MKFLFFVSFFHPHLGGHELYNLNLALELINLNHDVTIVTNNTEKKKNKQVFKGIKIVRLNCLNFLEGNYPVPKITELMKLFFKINNRYDFVVINTRFFALTIFGFLWAKLFKNRVIYIEHGSSEVFLNSSLLNSISRIVNKISLTFLTNYSEIVFTVSLAGKKFLIHNCKISKPIKILPNALNFELIENQSENAQIQLIKEKEKNKVIVLFIGRLIYAKGVQDLISVIKEFNNVLLLVVGDGPYKRDLEEISSNNVIFFGNQALIKPFFTITDILVNPSYSESLPTTIIEAGYFRKPVIASNVGGTKELLIENKTGLLFNPKNKQQLKIQLIKLINDSELRKLLGENLHSLILENHNWKINVKIFLKEIGNQKELFIKQ